MARTSGSAQACCGVTSAVRSESDLKRNSCQAEGDGGEGGGEGRGRHLLL